MSFESEDDTGTIEIDFGEFLYPKKNIGGGNNFIKVKCKKKDMFKQSQKVKEAFEGG